MGSREGLGRTSERLSGNRKHHSELRKKPVQRVRGKKNRHWKEKVESVTYHLRMWFSGSEEHCGPKQLPRSKEKWHSTIEIKILAMIKSKNKNKPTTGQRFQNNRETVSSEAEKTSI